MTAIAVVLLFIFVVSGMTAFFMKNDNKNINNK